MVHFGEFLKTWSLRSNSVTSQVSFKKAKNCGKCQNAKNSDATFWVIFKQCALAAKNYSELNNKLLCLYMMVTLHWALYLSLSSGRKKVAEKSKAEKNPLLHTL